jgi:hypothetical protein
MGVRRVVTGAAEQAFASVEDAIADVEAKLEPEVTLNRGDTVVQNGTRHRWKNPGDKPARMALFICGADHAMVPPPD